MKKRFVNLFILIGFLIIGRYFILFLIEPVDYSIYFNQILKNKTAEHDNKIDMVFVGGSRGLRTFDPVVFEKTMNMDCIFNASSGLQPIESSYYMLKELIERYHPKYAVVALSWDELFDTNSTLAKVIVLDRLTGKNKLKYLLNEFSIDEYLNAVSLCYRFRNNFEADKIHDIVIEKINLSKNHYSERLSYPDLYTDNGFIYSYQNGDIPNYGNISYDPTKLEPKKIEYLEKIYEMCHLNQVHLFLVSAPTTVMTLYRVENYQKAVDFYSDFAETHGLNYVNLNYLRGREKWLGDDLMFDFNHVNGEGAEIVSEKYAQYLNAIIHEEKIQDLFYKDLQEFQSEVHRIIAVGADIYIGDLQASVKVSSRQSDGITPMYRIKISQDNQNFIDLTDWTSETDFLFDVSSYHDTVYFQIEAISTTGEPGCSIFYQMEI